MFMATHLIGFGAGNQTPDPVQTNLQLHLDAGDAASYSGSGQSWLDLTANSLDYYLGTGSGADASDPLYTNAGPNAYFAFDGGDYCSQQAAYSGSILRKLGRTDQAFTFEMWIYKKSGDNQGLAISTESTDDGFAAVFSNTNLGSSTDKLVVSTGTSTNMTANNTAISNDAWHQIVIAGKWDGSTTNTFYVDSVADGTFTKTGGFVSANDSERPLRIGARNDGALPLASGSRVAIVRIYDAILTADQVRQNFDANRARYGI